MCKVFSLFEPELLYFRNKKKFCHLWSTEFILEPDAEGSSMCNSWSLHRLLLESCGACTVSWQHSHTSPWAMISHWELNKKVKQKYHLGHSRIEEQSLNMKQLLKVYFFASSLSLVKSRSRASILKSLTFGEWSNNKEFLIRGLLERMFTATSLLRLSNSVQVSLSCFASC